MTDKPEIRKPSPSAPDLESRIQDALRRIISEIPESEERPSDDPEARAHAIVNRSASNAALVSGGLALPPGPAGMLTILPDLIAIWRIQRQMVADVAAVFGRKQTLSKEQMLFCLFRHAASQALRDIVVRVGQRYLVRRASLGATQKVLQRVGVSVTQRMTGRVISRWLPIIGAAGVGAYAYYDTAQVGATAVDLFRSDIEIEGDGAGKNRPIDL